MEQIKQYINENNTIKLMLLNKDNEYNKIGALEQIRLDTGLSEQYVYSKYFQILSFVS